MGWSDVFIHPAAHIHPHARLEEGVWVGPGCIIGEHVSVGSKTRLEGYVVLDGWTEVGPRCRFSPYAVIGTEPQDVTYKGEETRVVIGQDNIFREFVTVHRGTLKGGGVTRIGDGNYFMDYVHIAHDCQVGNGCLFINGATLGGHVVVDDYAYISAFSAFHPFCRVGKHALVGGGSIVTQDVVPFSRVAGNRPAYCIGLNVIGLRRRGFSNDRIHSLKEIFQILFYSGLNTSQAVERIRAECPPSEDREEIISFITSSKRGIVKKVSDTWENESG